MTKVYVVAEDIPYEGSGMARVFSSMQKAEEWLKKTYPHLHLRDENSKGAYYDTGAEERMRYFDVDEVDLDPDL